MTLALITTTITLACSAFGCGGESPAAPKNVTLGPEFSHKPGEEAIVEGADLQVGFDGVASDSRCPVDVDCIWEGEAVVNVWTRHPPDPKTSHELKTRGTSREVAYAGYVLRLTSLAPQPKAGVKIEPKDYVATFTVVRK
jgi:hypothetical protein